MSSVTPMHPINHDAAAALLASAPDPNGFLDRDEVRRVLPGAPNYALLLILAEFDYDADPTCRLAVAARVIGGLTPIYLDPYLSSTYSEKAKHENF